VEAVIDASGGSVLSHGCSPAKHHDSIIRLRYKSNIDHMVVAGNS